MVSKDIYRLRAFRAHFVELEKQCASFASDFGDDFYTGKQFAYRSVIEMLDYLFPKFQEDSRETVD